MTTVGGLCSGIAGLEKAVCAAFDAEVAWHSEIDPDASKVLAARFPDVPNLGDLTAVDWANLKEVSMTKKTSESQRVSAVAMYEAGMSCQQIATYYKVSRQSIWDVLRRRTTMRSNLRYGEDNHFWRGGQTEDDRAQNVVEYAIKIGLLVPPPSCEICGGTKTFTDGRRGIQAHHPDYNHPLQVMWLCQPCHHQWHAENRAVPLEGGDANGSLADVDIICFGFP